MRLSGLTPNKVTVEPRPDLAASEKLVSAEANDIIETLDENAALGVAQETAFVDKGYVGLESGVVGNMGVGRFKTLADALDDADGDGVFLMNAGSHTLPNTVTKSIGGVAGAYAEFNGNPEVSGVVTFGVKVVEDSGEIDVQESASVTFEKEVDGDILVRDNASVYALADVDDVDLLPGAFYSGSGYTDSVDSDNAFALLRGFCDWYYGVNGSGCVSYGGLYAGQVTDGWLDSYGNASSLEATRGFVWSLGNVGYAFLQDGSTGRFYGNVDEVDADGAGTQVFINGNCRDVNADNGATVYVEGTIETVIVGAGSVVYAGGKVGAVLIFGDGQFYGRDGANDIAVFDLGGLFNVLGQVGEISISDDAQSNNDVGSIETQGNVSVGDGAGLNCFGSQSVGANLALGDGAGLVCLGSQTVAGNLTLGDGAVLDCYGAQTVYGNLTLGDGASFVCFSPQSVAGNLTIGDGAYFDCRGSQSVAGDLNIGDGSSLDCRGSQSVAGNLVMTDNGAADILSFFNIGGDIELGDANTMDFQGGGIIRGDIVDNSSVTPSVVNTTNVYLLGTDAGNLAVATNASLIT